MCVQVPCVYLLSAASTVIRNSHLCPSWFIWMYLGTLLYEGIPRGHYSSVQPKSHTCQSRKYFVLGGLFQWIPELFSLLLNKFETFCYQYTYWTCLCINTYVLRRMYMTLPPLRGQPTEPAIAGGNPSRKERVCRGVERCQTRIVDCYLAVRRATITPSFRLFFDWNGLHVYPVYIYPRIP